MWFKDWDIDTNEEERKRIKRNRNGTREDYIKASFLPHDVDLTQFFPAIPRPHFSRFLLLQGPRDMAKFRVETVTLPPIKYVNVNSCTVVELSFLANKMNMFSPRRSRCGGVWWGGLETILAGG